MNLPIKQYLPLCFAALLFFSSCTSSKKVIYFNDLTDSAGHISTAKQIFEAKIQKNDQLSIVVGGSNNADLLVLNSAGGMSSSGGASSIGKSSASGFLVEADGNIKLPYIGKLKAEGLTRTQLEDTLTQLFKDYTKNPVVNVRFLNYYYSVMGEVAHSGRYDMSTERTTLLEAISQAGDITEFGRRENILVIREENGQRNFVRLNITSKDFFSSPYFYLKTNDVVYVEPVKAKFISRSGIPQYLAIIAVGLSLILTIITIRNH